MIGDRHDRTATRTKCSATRSNILGHYARDGSNFVGLVGLILVFVRQDLWANYLDRWPTRGDLSDRRPDTFF
jgi:hypothetical protein